MTDMDMPLPEPAHRGPTGTGSYFNSFTADQLHARDAQWRAIVAAEVAKERERICAAIMAKHEAANGQHNLYHCLAVELFGDEAIRAAAPPQCTSAPSEPQ